MAVGSSGVQWGPVGIGYVRPVQFLDHLTVIKRNISHFCVDRKQIRVSKIVPHESFDFSFYDIALLKLGTDFFL